MSDGVDITAGSGTTVSTEEITTLNGVAVDARHVQRITPAVITADGTAVDVTSAAPLPVTISGGATAANQATANASLSTITGHVDGIETALAAGVSSTGNVAHGATDSGNPVKVGGKYNSGGVTLTDGQRGDLQLDASGKLNVNPGALISTSDSVTAITQPATSGGLTTFQSLDIDESEEEIKASAGQLYGYYIYNAAAGVRYVKFYNATAASVTVGTTAPLFVLPIPATSAANLMGTHGIEFSTAISVAATTGVANSDTGAPSANDVQITCWYK